MISEEHDLIGLWKYTRACRQNRVWDTPQKKLKNNLIEQIIADFILTLWVRLITLKQNIKKNFPILISIKTFLVSFDISHVVYICFMWTSNITIKYKQTFI